MGLTTSVDSEIFIVWRVKVRNLLSISCGESS